jgi:hypothetical protein
LEYLSSFEELGDDEQLAHFYSMIESISGAILYGSEQMGSDWVREIVK